MYGGALCAISSLCFCAGTVEYSRTLLFRTRRKTRPCRTLHPPIADTTAATIATTLILDLAAHCIHRLQQRFRCHLDKTHPA